MLWEGIMFVIIIFVKIDVGFFLGGFICLKLELILFFELSINWVEVIMLLLLISFLSIFVNLLIICLILIVIDLNFLFFNVNIMWFWLFVWIIVLVGMIKLVEFILEWIVIWVNMFGFNV